MCGIVGILGRGPIAGQVVDALKRLEYRGYDSSGVATLEDGRLQSRRAEGKLVNLQLKLSSAPLSGAIGIGHTRWATHGRPSETNAHPHATDRLAVVHNGIIENYRALRTELERKGCRFDSDTDTEVVAHLVTEALKAGLEPFEAVQSVVPQLQGAYALAFLFDGREDLLIGVRRGAPLAVGLGEGEAYLGSDAIALAPFTSEMIFLEEGDCAVLTRTVVQIFDHRGRAVERSRTKLAAESLCVEKGGYTHFMLKEINEQPDVIARTLAQYVDFSKRQVCFDDALIDRLRSADRLSITACGTAFYAGLIARYWFEDIAALPIDIDVASEVRYRRAPAPRNAPLLVVSQSGETADTLAALRHASEQGAETIAILNAPMSTIAREAKFVVPTLAGPEIGVASTKAFTCQLSVLLCLAIAAARARGAISSQEEGFLVDALTTVPGLVASALKQRSAVVEIARELARARSVIYMGRGTSYPLALEGALKLKEITYIHAEGFAAGELKHGPIALIDEHVPVVVIAPEDFLFEKTASNLQEVAARRGRVVLISRPEHESQGTVSALPMPHIDRFVAPIVYAVPLQLLAFETALLMGRDVDQPRNLAKSVTVE